MTLVVLVVAALAGAAGASSEAGAASLKPGEGVVAGPGAPSEPRGGAGEGPSSAAPAKQGSTAAASGDAAGAGPGEPGTPAKGSAPELSSPARPDTSVPEAGAAAERGGAGDTAGQKAGRGAAPPTSQRTERAPTPGPAGGVTFLGRARKTESSAASGPLNFAAYREKLTRRLYPVRQLDLFSPVLAPQVYLDGFGLLVERNFGP